MPPIASAHCAKKSPARALADLTVPMLLSIAANIGVAVIDVWFVSKLGTEELAAISFTFPVAMLVISVVLGIGIGCSSILARTIGAGDGDDARDLSGHGLILILLVIGLLIAVGYASINPLFALMGAEPHLMPDIRVYMTIWYASALPITLTMTATQMLRAAGDARLPAKIVIGGAVLNVCLDPILIFGVAGIPGLGLAGAAWALLLSRLITMAILLVALQRRYDYGRLRFGYARILYCWRRILHVGLPAAATHVIGPVSILIVTRLIADYGTVAIAGHGVAARIESLLVMPLFALSASIGPYVGQNMGAGHSIQVRQGVKVAHVWVLVWGVLATIILGFGAWPIARLFDDNEAVQQVAVYYLYLVPWSYGAWGILMVITATFNAMGRALPSTIMAFLRMFVLYVPLAILGSRWLGYQGIFLASAVTNLIMAVVAFLWLRLVLFSGGTFAPWGSRLSTVHARSSLEHAQAQSRGVPTHAPGARPTAPADCQRVP